jgi:hypothetical protein
MLYALEGMVQIPGRLSDAVMLYKLEAMVHMQSRRAPVGVHTNAKKFELSSISLESESTSFWQDGCKMDKLRSA